MDISPNYKNYTLEELFDVQKQIDKELYPQRTIALENEIANRLANPEKEQGEQESEQASQTIKNKYATFWRRFGAAIIDSLIFAAVVHIESWVLGLDLDYYEDVLTAFNGIQYAVYLIVMHGIYGQTIGKMITGVEVLNHDDESKINLMQALRRESVTLLLSVGWFAPSLLMYSTFNFSWTMIDVIDYAILAFSMLIVVWFITEYVTMLLNKKRRAVHDYIGKTVVVRVD